MNKKILNLALASIALAVTSPAEAEEERSEMYKEITRQTFNKKAPEYHQRTIALRPDDKTSFFLSYLSAQDSILDVGCGSGRDAKYFTEKGFGVTGVDLSEVMIEVAQENAPQASFVIQDIEEMEFPEQSFNGIWASASLLHIPKNKMKTVLTDLYSFLKDEGVFFISLKEGEGEALHLDHRYGGLEEFLSFYKEDEIVSFLEEAGFTIVDQHTYPILNSYQTHPWITIVCQKEKA